MNKKAISIESLFVMLLFTIFAVSIVMMIISGKTSYGKILDEKKQAEEMRITTSYLRMKLKQNDQAKSVFVQHVPDLGIELLELRHGGEDSEYRTVIYFYENRIWEAYLSVEDEFETALGEPVIEFMADAVRFERTDKGLNINYVWGEKEIQQFVALTVEE